MVRITDRARVEGGTFEPKGMALEPVASDPSGSQS